MPCAFESSCTTRLTLSWPRATNAIAAPRFADEGRAKAGAAASNSDSTTGERVERMVVCQDERRRNRVYSFLIDIHETSSCRRVGMI